MINSSLQVIEQGDIRNKIYVIRGIPVMLDEDLAKLYEITTGRLNEQVKRNRGRFPCEFRFKLAVTESRALMSQIAISNPLTASQKDNSEKRGGRTKLPYVFTEQGVAMLSAVLKSDVAVYMSIKIINAFVSMRRMFASNSQLKEFNRSHDRFLIIDDKDVYHFGASIKDLGKKWFAFSKFDKQAFSLLSRLD